MRRASARRNQAAEEYPTQLHSHSHSFSTPLLTMLRQCLYARHHAFTMAKYAFALQKRRTGVES